MPKGYKADGTPIKPAGRKNNNKVKKGPFWFDQDVVAILDKLPPEISMTDYTQDAIRLKKYCDDNGITFDLPKPG